MLTAIRLYNQEVFGAGKIGDETPDRKLSTEFIAPEATAPQDGPKATFGIGRTATEQPSIPSQSRQRSCGSWPLALTRLTAVRLGTLSRNAREG